MKLGIIGLPQSGKTTIFNALTHSNRPLAMSAGRIEITTAVVDVPDARLDKLAALFASKKIVRAQISFADVAGIGSGDGTKGAGLSNQLLNALSGMDGLMLVVRAFPDENVAHPSGSVDAARDLAAVSDELLLNDLIIVERKLEKLKEERGKGGKDIAAIERQQALFGKLHAALSDGKALRDAGLTADEATQSAGIGLLTLKPILVVINLGEGQAAPALAAANSLALQGKLEMELAQLSAEEQAVFLTEYGLQEPGSLRIIRAAYDLMDTQTFYTVGEPEAHAWMLRRNASALDAAGAIHSDIARGFIRAEIVAGDELLQLGGMAQARDKGRLRLEGKEYKMADGDIINIRFNV
jgi:GTP-binding protein YchF